jgi:hypothetical protein
LVDRPKQVIAVGVDVVDSVIGVILEFAIQVSRGADGANVIDVTRRSAGAGGRVRSRFANGGQAVARPRESLVPTGFQRTDGASTSLHVGARLTTDCEGTDVEVKIGITDSPRELVFTSTQTPSEVEDLVNNALGKGSDVLGLTDDKGRRFVVNSAKIAYVEIGVADARRVGFGIGSHAAKSE